MDKTSKTPTGAALEKMAGALVLALATAAVAMMSPGAAASCPEGYKVDLPSCASVTLTNRDHNYHVSNDCSFSMMVNLRVNTGQEIIASVLAPGESDGASLPEGITVDAVHCCTFEEPEYQCSEPQQAPPRQEEQPDPEAADPCSSIPAYHARMKCYQYQY